MRSVIHRAALTAAAALLLTTATHAQVTTLYDGSLGTSPGAQGWTEFVPPPATQTVSGGKTTLNTTASNLLQAGYSRTPFTLDRSAGYSVRFDVRLLSESHANNNRAGFDVIVLSSDLQGIELGFWTNEVWAQSGPTFTHAEGAAFDTTAALGGLAGTTRYDLQVSGSSYTLFANGSSLLTGALRDYSSFGAPYNVPNFLFLGDDTTSANGAAEIAFVAVTVAAPEPGAGSFLLLGGFLAAGGSVLRRRAGR